MASHRLASRKGALRLVALGAAAALTTTLLPWQAASAQTGSAQTASAQTASARYKNRCDNRPNNTYEKLLDCVTVEGVQRHLRAFQRIADNSTDPVYPGTRAAGTDGYDDSVRYVSRLLRRAGYRVTLDPVDITFNFPAKLRQITPVAATYETGVFTGSGDGTVQGNVIPVDINLTGDRASTSGCEAADFTGLRLQWPERHRARPARHVLLRHQGVLRRAGRCRSGHHLQPGQHSGPRGPGRSGRHECGSPDSRGARTGHSRHSGGRRQLRQRCCAGAGGLDARVRVLPAETRSDYNVIAELPGKNRNNVVMAGAHLDSVIEGPGINDNGSGSAALLETALKMAKIKPQNTLRFGWWAAEEQGLVGSDGLRRWPLRSATRSDRAVHELRHGCLAQLHLHGLRRRRIHVPGAGGGDDPGRLGCDRRSVRVVLHQARNPVRRHRVLRTQRLPGVHRGRNPVGGLFTGAEEIKTEEQEAIWGGTAGEQFDQCYHEECDDISNISRRALRINSDLIAFAMLTFAYSTESVNGVPGKRVPGRPFRLPVPAGPEGTFAEDGGGGLNHGATQ